MKSARGADCIPVKPAIFAPDTWRPYWALVLWWVPVGPACPQHGQRVIPMALPEPASHLVYRN